MFAISKKNNIITSILSILNIKFTQTFTEKYYNGHPHKLNLFGISKILADYGINNKAYSLSDKNMLSQLEVPFVAQASNNLVIVKKITDSSVDFLWGTGEESVEIEEFKDIWTGIVLLIQDSEGAIEPNYEKNQKAQHFKTAQKSILLFLIIIGLTGGFLVNPLHSAINFITLIIINLAGLSLGYLLVLKQVDIHSFYSDKLCSVFKKGNCNDVLDTPAAKFMGVIGWSELGLGYFFSNLCLLLFFPGLINYFLLLNLLVLPYSFWSIWYQWRVAKQWCVLCVGVQIILWTMFLTGSVSGILRTPSFEWHESVVFLVVYFVPPVTINLLLPVIISANREEILDSEIKSMRLSEGAFFSALKKEPSFNVNRNTSSIIFGNENSKMLITVFTNPFCNPCAKMHGRLEKLMEKVGDYVCLQYIFSYFETVETEDVTEVNRKLIAIYMNYDRQVVKKIYQDWFKNGIATRSNFFDGYQVETNEWVEREFESHNSWKKETGLRETPTILINGHIFPKAYQLEDIEYLVS